VNKNQLITGVIILAFVGAFVAINRMEPSRVTDEQLEDAEEVQEQIDEAERAEAEAVAAESGRGEEEEADEPPDLPEPYRVAVEASNGTFVLEIYPEWAPIGAARFREATEAGVYDGARFCRVVPNFVVQWGIPADPQMAAKWSEATIDDEAVKVSNVRGTITFAKSRAPNSRTTQVFINLVDNTQLDGMGFAPFGKVIEGMEVVDGIEAKYGQTPDQQMIQTRGNAYLKEYFPDLDYIVDAEILGPGESPDGAVLEDGASGPASASSDTGDDE